MEDGKNTEEKIKEFFAKSAKVTKEAFGKASDAVQNFSDKSVLKIENTQLKNNRNKKYQELGEKLSALLLQKNSDIENLGALSKSSENKKLLEEIKSIQKEIVQITKDISNRSKELEAVSSKKQIKK